MRTSLQTLYCAAWVSWFSTSLLGPIYALYVQGIGGDILDAGMAWAVYSLVVGFLTIFLGKAEDKFGDRRWALVAGYCILTLGTLAYLLVRTPSQLLLVQVILGIGTAIYYPAWDGLFSQAIHRGKESADWAVQEGGAMIAGGIAALVGSFFVDRFGFGSLFIVMALLQSVSVVLALHLLSPFHKNVTNAKKCDCHRSRRRV